MQRTDGTPLLTLEGPDPTPALPSTSTPSQKSVRPEIRKMIGEMAIRFQPSINADLAAHTAKVAFLTIDLADLPPRALENAIAEYVLNAVYLPKAAEIIEIVNRQAKARTIHKIPNMTLHERADLYNASSNRPKSFGDVQWLVRGGELVIDWVRDGKGQILER